MKKFKQFYSANGAMIFKLTVTQVSMSVFSLIITIAMRAAAIVSGAPRGLLYSLASIAGILFYWFLVHDFLWQRGAHDAPGIASGRIPRDPLKGLKTGACALLPTLILSAVYIISYLIAVPTQSVIAGSTNTVVAIPLFYLLNGMYYGFFSLAEGTYWMPVVAALSCVLSLAFPTLAYALGIKEKKLRSFVGLENLDLPEKKDKRR